MDPNLATGIQVVRMCGHWAERHWLAIGSSVAAVVFVADRLRTASALQGHFPHFRNRRGRRRPAADGTSRRREP